MRLPSTSAAEPPAGGVMIANFAWEGCGTADYKIGRNAILSLR
jgi:hypothetical protein